MHSAKHEISVEVEVFIFTLSEYHKYSFYLLDRISDEFKCCWLEDTRQIWFSKGKDVIFQKPLWTQMDYTFAYNANYLTSTEKDFITSFG